MRRATSVAAVLLSAGVAWGQPGGPGGPSPAGGPSGPGGAVEKADPQVEAWVKTLTEKMNDPHDAIRESARAALVSVGSPALPALRQLAGGNDAKAFTARRLVQQIERGVGFAAMGGFTGGGFGVPGGFGNPFQPQPGASGPPQGPGPGGPPQGPPTGRPGAEPVPSAPPPLRDIIGELKLNEKQRAQVEKAVEGYATKLRGLLDGARSGKLDRNELRDAAKKLADEATAELNRALTAEQRELLERLTPRGRPLLPTPFEPNGTNPGRPERPNPETPDRPRPNPDGGR